MVREPLFVVRKLVQCLCCDINEPTETRCRAWTSDGLFVYKRQKVNETKQINNAL